jgi:hypothetical protein
MFPKQNFGKKEKNDFAIVETMNKEQTEGHLISWKGVQPA